MRCSNSGCARNVPIPELRVEALAQSRTVAHLIGIWGQGGETEAHV